MHAHDIANALKVFDINIHELSNKIIVKNNEYEDLYNTDNQINKQKLAELLAKFGLTYKYSKGNNADWFMGSIGGTTLSIKNTGTTTPADWGIYRYRYIFEVQFHYKIHLMPYKEDVGKVIDILLTAMQKNLPLSKSIAGIKVFSTFGTKDNRDGILPTIVIYATPGKDNAQTVLNAVYTLFKDQHGIDKTPRYNRKITTLIYYAQGDADHKRGYGWADYFEAGDEQGVGRVHLLPNVLYNKKIVSQKNLEQLKKQHANAPAQIEKFLKKYGEFLGEGGEESYSKYKYEEFPFPENNPDGTYHLINPATGQLND